MRRAALAVLVNSVIATSLHAQSASAGRLEGIVIDSIRAQPIAGALVRATRLGTDPEVTVSAIADRQGRYRFARLDSGSYAVSVASALLDSLEYGGPVARVTVSARRPGTRFNRWPARVRRLPTGRARSSAP